MELMEFSKREIIQRSWQALKGHLGLWMLIMLFIFSINIIISIVQNKLLVDITAQTILFIISAFLFQAGINLGMLRIALNINNVKEVGFNQIFGSFHMLIPYIMATMILVIILLAITAPGFILLLIFISSDFDSIFSFEWINGGTIIIPALFIILPAIYTSIRLQYYDYFLIDEECGVLDSIKNSLNATKGYVGELFLLGIILSIIVLISIIPLGTGLIISIPLGIMINTHVYQKLKKTAPKD